MSAKQQEIQKKIYIASKKKEKKLKQIDWTSGKSGHMRCTCTELKGPELDNYTGCLAGTFRWVLINRLLSTTNPAKLQHSVMDVGFESGTPGEFGLVSSVLVRNRWQLDIDFMLPSTGFWPRSLIITRSGTQLGIENYSACSFFESGLFQIVSIRHYAFCRL